MEKKTGLTSDEAKKRLEKYGPNILPEKPPPSNLQIFLTQIKNPLVYVLVAAGIVTFLTEQIPDTVIIAFAIVINATLGYFQEKKASKALLALKKLIHPQAKVVRDGVEVEISVENIVPGDLVIITSGGKVPAGGEIVEANRLFVDEAILTGESVPVEKKIKSDVYMGTVVVSGNGQMIVETTGSLTQVGKIAEAVQTPDEATPLKKQLTIFSKQLSIMVVALVLFVFIIGVLRGLGILEIFETSVALAVSSIPEGILVGLTVVLAIGMQRILKRKGLVRHLISAETLGGVTTICVDKTGTLTQGRMQVVSAVGDEKDIATQMVLANDHDEPMVITAFNWAVEKLKGQNPKLKVGEMQDKYTRLDSIPFTSDNKYFASLHRWGKKNMIFINGAPDILMHWSKIDNQQRAVIINHIEELTKQGKRLLGLARKTAVLSKKKLTESDVKSDLEWIGLLVFSDPVRVGVKEALEKTKKAGIKLMVITGDYPQTAVSVMKQLDMEICEECLIMGSSLKNMSVNDLKKRMTKGNPLKLFARTTPQQKLKIVQSLKESGEVVAMMGDGVNDAPALQRADIGIVVGEATDVAKESADLVLLDSSFATIVAAIEEGRGIFDNVRKIILYLMSDAFEEIVAVVGTIILGLPLPVTAAQILWINLISDGFPDMALTVDPKAKNIMERPPRSPKENLVSKWMKELIFIVSLTGGIVALGLFIYVHNSTGDTQMARSVAFATLGVNSLFYVFSVKTLREPFWRTNPFDNMWLNVSVLLGFGFQLIPFLTPSLRNFFGVSWMHPFQWLLVIVASIVMFIVIEVSKAILQNVRG